MNYSVNRESICIMWSHQNAGLFVAWTSLLWRKGTPTKRNNRDYWWGTCSELGAVLGARSHLIYTTTLWGWGAPLAHFSRRKVFFLLEKAEGEASRQRQRGLSPPPGPTCPTVAFWLPVQEEQIKMGEPRGPDEGLEQAQLGVPTSCGDCKC